MVDKELMNVHVKYNVDECEDTYNVVAIGPVYHSTRLVSDAWLLRKA